MNGHMGASDYDLTTRPDELLYGLIVIPSFSQIRCHPDMYIVYETYKRLICDKIVRLLTADFYAQKRYMNASQSYTLEFLQTTKDNLAEEVEYILYEDADTGVESVLYNSYEANQIYNNLTEQVIHFTAALIELLVDAIIIPIRQLLMTNYLIGIWLEYERVGFTSPISLEVVLTKRSPAFIQEIYQ